MTTELQFADRNEALHWIITNQLGRRNLSAYDRSILALKLKPVIAAKAKEKQIESGGAVPQKSAKPPIETRAEIAKAAGVSHDTIAKVEKIEAQASPEFVLQAPSPSKVSLRTPPLISYEETNFWLAQVLIPAFEKQLFCVDLGARSNRRRSPEILPALTRLEFYMNNPVTFKTQFKFRSESPYLTNRPRVKVCKAPKIAILPVNRPRMPQIKSG